MYTRWGGACNWRDNEDVYQGMVDNLLEAPEGRYGPPTW